MKTKNKMDNKGFTLVEIIVTLAIFAIVLTVAGTVYFAGNRMYTQTEIKNQEKYIGDTVFNYMRDRLVYAKDVSVYVSGTNPSSVSYSNVFNVTSDKMCFGTNKDPANVLGDSWYGNYKIKYIAKKATDNTLNLTVSVLDTSNNEVYSTGSTMKIINLVGAVVWNTDTDGAVNQVISYRTKDGSNDSVDTAIGLRNAYIDIYEKLFDKYTANNNSLTVAQIQSIYPDWTQYVTTNQTNISNDNILAYLYGKTYGSSWPVYPVPSDSILGKTKYKLVKTYYDNKNPTLYLRPYCYVGNSLDKLGKSWAENNCFIFVSSNNQSKSNWNAAFIIDCSERKTYVTQNTNYYKTEISPVSIPFDSWKNVKTILADETKWLIFE